MGAVYGNLGYKPLQSAYVPKPVEEINKAAINLSDKYALNASTISALDKVYNTSDIDPSHVHIVDELRNKTKAILEEPIATGRLENADVAVNNAVALVGADAKFNAALKYKKEFNDFKALQQERLKANKIDYDKYFTTITDIKAPDIIEDETGYAHYDNVFESAPDNVNYQDKLTKFLSVYRPDVEGGYTTKTDAYGNDLLVVESLTTIGKEQLRKDLNLFLLGDPETKNDIEWSARKNKITEEEVAKKIAEPFIGAAAFDERRVNVNVIQTQSDKDRAISIKTANKTAETFTEEGVLQGQITSNPIFFGNQKEEKINNVEELITFKDNLVHGNTNSADENEKTPVTVLERKLDNEYYYDATSKNWMIRVSDKNHPNWMNETRYEENVYDESSPTYLGQKKKYEKTLIDKESVAQANAEVFAIQQNIAQRKFKLNQVKKLEKGINNVIANQPNSNLQLDENYEFKVKGLKKEEYIENEMYFIKSLKGLTLLEAGEKLNKIHADLVQEERKERDSGKKPSKDYRELMNKLTGLSNYLGKEFILHIDGNLSDKITDAHIDEISLLKEKEFITEQKKIEKSIEPIKNKMLKEKSDKMYASTTIPTEIREGEQGKIYDKIEAAANTDLNMMNINLFDKDGNEINESTEQTKIYGTVYNGASKGLELVRIAYDVSMDKFQSVYLPYQMVKQGTGTAQKVYSSNYVYSPDADKSIRSFSDKNQAVLQMVLSAFHELTNPVTEDFQFRLDEDNKVVKDGEIQGEVLGNAVRLIPVQDGYSLYVLSPNKKNYKETTSQQGIRYTDGWLNPNQIFSSIPQVADWFSKRVIGSEKK